MYKILKIFFIRSSLGESLIPGPFGADGGARLADGFFFGGIMRGGDVAAFYSGLDFVKGFWRDAVGTVVA